MNKLLIMAAMLLAAAAVAPLAAEDLSQLYSNPSVPPREAQDRLRLKTAWTVQVPMESRRDGLFSVQLLASSTGYDLLIQTRSGGVLMLDAVTGQRRWYTVVGVPYRAASNPAGYNSESMFVINNIELFVLDRANGRQQWQYQLPSGGASPPLADSQQVYVNLTNGRFNAYALPNLALREQEARQRKASGEAAERLEAARALRAVDVPAIGPLSGVAEAYRNPAAGPQPTERYSFVPDERADTVPVQAEDRILLPGADGLISGVAKATATVAWPSVRAHGKVRMPLGQYDDTAYVATTAADLYAISISSGHVLWHAALGGVPTDRPAVLDKDVYVPVDRSRLFRLRREDGEEMWRNDDAGRFLAANQKFVYAADRHGRLLVIDRERGSTLSTYDGTRDFPFPLANEWTDRVYLFANNGLIVCLHDRDADRPLVMKKIKEPPAPRGKPGGKLGEKPAPKEMGDGGKPGGKPKGPEDGMKP